MPEWEPAYIQPWSSPTQTVLGYTTRQVDIDHDALSKIGGTESIREGYLRQNAFLARLVQMERCPSDIELFGLVALRWALEDDLNARGYDLNLPGAAVWILYAVEYIFMNKRKQVEKTEDRVGIFTSAHPWWDDEKCSGFCRERWNLWKAGSGQLAVIEEIAQRTRDMAKQAFECMERIENI